MIKLSNITRSQEIVKKLLEANTTIGYIDDPGIKWVFDISPWHRGFMTVYKTDCGENVFSYGEAHYGYQDTTRTIINRSNANAIILEQPVLLSELLKGKLVVSTNVILDGTSDEILDTDCDEVLDAS